MTCDDCKHARPLTGIWYVGLGDTYARCVVNTAGEPVQAKMFIVAKVNPCAYTPSKWEKR